MRWMKMVCPHPIARLVVLLQLKTTVVQLMLWFHRVARPSQFASPRETPLTHTQMVNSTVFWSALVPRLMQRVNAHRIMPTVLLVQPASSVIFVTEARVYALLVSPL